MEIWKDVPGFEGVYMVSNLGNVRRVRTTRKPFRDRFGYMNLVLCNNGAEKYCKIHRLVAEAFIPNPDGKDVVNHIDGNKGNNHVKNLEWVTQCENMKHAYKMGLKIPTRKAVFCTKDGIRNEFQSMSDGAKFVFGHTSGIHKCCMGILKTYKGYEWGLLTNENQ